jgi:uncharacterized protein
VEAKRRSNVDEHGIDFIRTVQVFDGQPRLDGTSPRGDENRMVTVAALEGRLIAVVWTWRGDNTVRIISARRARIGEERAYEQVYG